MTMKNQFWVGVDCCNKTDDIARGKTCVLPAAPGEHSKNVAGVRILGMGRLIFGHAWELGP